MPHIWTVSFNAQETAFEDERVRLAVHHAIDREGMANQLLAGTALPGESWLSRTSDAFEPNDRWHAYDPAKARALLEEADAVGTEIVFVTSTSGSGQMQPAAMAEWIQRNLNEVGFQTEIELMEWNAYLAKFFEGFAPNWSLVQMSWGWTGAYWLDMFLNPCQPTERNERCWRGGENNRRPSNARSKRGQSCLSRGSGHGERVGLVHANRQRYRTDRDARMRRGFPACLGLANRLCRQSLA